MNNIKSKLNSTLCTSCSACFNICPKNAITMQENNEGFKEAVIDENKCTDCGLCSKICPVLNPKYDNNKKPNCYAFMASNEIRKNSASGGVFPVLAYDFIQIGGYVAGAVWDSDWTVKHIVSNKKEDIEKMRSSKYLQSNINNCYKEIKNLLADNKQVLFTGTPCQIAGLKAYLNKDYKNLYCVDIVCHGVPSQKVFKKYLIENYEINKIKQIDFRKKEQNGWGTSILYIETNDKKQYVPWHKDSYYTLFLKGVTLKKSCTNCKFNKLPRQGDLTMADFWGIKEKYNDKLGTSVITVNNNKGKYLFKILKENSKLCVKQNLKSAYENNYNLIKSSTINECRDEFYKMLNTISINYAKEKYIDDKCDCMILNFWSAVNYGAILTCYGVQCLCEKLGYESKVINLIGNPEGINCKFEESFAYEFAKKYLKLTQRVKTYDDFFKLNEKTNTFVVGSDQVWRRNCISDLINKDLNWTLFFLDFVRSNKKKISYSASFGIDAVEGNATDIEKMNYYLSQFDNISVREISGHELLKDKFNIESKLLLDSVFHIPQKRLDEMTEPYKCDEKYIACFTLPYFKNQTWYKKIVNEIENKIKLPVKEFEFEKQISVEQWLAYIKNAKFLITDSYHGVLFSIIFNVPFIQIQNAKAQTRFDSVFEIFNIKNKTINKYTMNPNYEELLMPIDWNLINQRIISLKSEAEIWMKNALEKEKIVKQIYPNFIENDIIQERKILSLLAKKNKIQRKYYKYKILSSIFFFVKKYKQRRQVYKTMIKQIRKI